ncbi:MAG: endo-1,4-beta-xylanase [Povalibacter sp.]
MRFRALRYTVLLCAVMIAGCPIVGPLVDAGPDQTVNEGAKVTLEPNTFTATGTIKTYTWTQIAGPTVAVKMSKKGGVLTFTAPEADRQVKLEFQITVADNKGKVSPADTVAVTVNQVKFFGTAVGSPADYEHLLTYFNQITPENGGKWGSVEATRDVMVWDSVDTAYQFAKDHKLPFKFHTLIWGQQQPAWLDSLSPEEQLAEIDEWMAAVAQRYPDVDLIDVVNEPLNSPATYREALGGAGTSGYDWVVKSFQMARAHFPHAKLILNEYNTLMLDQFTANYLAVIDALKSQGLVDGIGEQAHFLERADLPVISANLDKLAAAGLPIYISELDLNFADDARHANRMRDLFKIFWDHPAVGGITHWGYRQGATWRTNGYLLRSDGTERPGLEWIVCYMGGGGDSCTVPPYVPAGWKGTEFGLTLEAEEYDQGSGVAALGNVVAYTDGGDWIGYQGVEFQQGWNTFWVTYAKGNTDPGSITVYLDSREGTPLFTLDLPPTGSWGSSKTLEQALSAITGTHDLYIVFNGTGGGVANVDNVRIGKPQPQSGINLVTDGGFETGTAGWSSWIGSTLTTSTAQKHSGNQSMQAVGRSSSGQFAVYSLTGKVQTNTTYAVSAWAYITGASNGTVRLASKLSCQGAADTYPWLENNTAVVPGTWTQLSGNLVIPASCTPTDVAIFFEGTDPSVDVYVDDVKVVPPSTDLVNDGGFETGTAGWSSWNGATLSAVTTQFHTGAQSLHATGRPNANQFAVYSLTGKVQTGKSYAVSAWALINGTGNGTVRLASKVACAGAADTYPWLQNNTGVVPGTWTQLAGNLVIPAGCDPTDVVIFFEGTDPAYDVYIDDVSATPL